MKDVTSFETTKKLLEADFPKSDDWGLQYFITEIGRLNRQKIGDEILGNGSINTIRASSALDILKVLGSRFAVRFNEILEKWSCFDFAEQIDRTIHENPAEAVAAMYLKVNEQKVN